MQSHALDLTNLAIIMAVAAALGLALSRMRLPAMVGYIAAGMMLGASGLGLVGREASDNFNALAELGVLMLLFIAGVEISIPSFRRVLRPAVITALGLVAAACAVAVALAPALLGWSARTAMLFGFIIAISSTAAALTILEDADELKTRAGEVTIGIMVAQDIIVVPMLIVVESFDAPQLDVVQLGLRIALALGIFAAILYIFRDGHQISFPGSRRLASRLDIVALAGLAMCFSAAAISGVAGLSPAYGAFVAGMLVGVTNLRGPAVRAIQPLQTLLLVIFFVSVGLLIDRTYIVENWVLVVSASLGVIAFKTVLAITLLRFSGVAWSDAVTAGLASSQIGEFSFILAGAGLAAGALNVPGYRLAITIIAATLLISPLWAFVVRTLHDRARNVLASRIPGLET
ncbi:MAG: cation:proton antiporter [Alphaproteobacteria bacterium]|nr:cation:proton antiporter [Alphaproteobacteria bacterium]